MRPFTLTALLLAACCVKTLSAEEIPIALLWVPGVPAQLQQELSALSTCEDCRLTIALAPEKIPAALRDVLNAEMAKAKWSWLCAFRETLRCRCFSLPTARK